MTFSTKELLELLDNTDGLITRQLCQEADSIRREVYDNKIYIRGLIEISNICKNDCYYCGIRKSNDCVQRYRLSHEEIISCCSYGYDIGFRTFVLQGGEDPFWDDEKLCKLVSEIRDAFPACAITLSLGERSRKSYQRLFDAGANRYLLRHETANSCHYARLHPHTMTLDTRIRCLYDLKDIGFQTGCGFMVGSPYQTISNIVEDLMFIQEFKPEMVGIGPFIPAANTPFAAFESGSTDLTVKILSLVRIMLPRVLLPATTALATADSGGRNRGLMAGANVIMPNLSPLSVRKNYSLYDNKLFSHGEAAEEIENLKLLVDSIGYEISVDRGDYKSERI